MSAPDRITVYLASPALFTGDSADGTAADTDVVTDGHGLPYLPRHRLSARLRAGADDALSVAPDLRAAADDVLGRDRSHGPDRILRLGHAVMADTVRDALVWALDGRDEPERTALRRAVTDACTALESSTEAGPDGAPVPGRLRTHRVLLPGLTLTAPLVWAAPPTAEHWRILARACLATTRIGLRGSRGRGRVDVRLAPPAGDPHAATLALAARRPVEPPVGGEEART
ncbi:hypothetical protein [Nocardiopsis sp. CNT312]|uniref:hypothetical protein n=1 Tax=Nocardiopsis sp. CNT312 TaxID=1137268 RepID=UPI00068666A9|nr:hypothetical protein [Nocardiopsis sp. CNT312]